jgi:hypothetical protein
MRLSDASLTTDMTGPHSPPVKTSSTTGSTRLRKSVSSTSQSAPATRRSSRKTTSDASSSGPNSDPQITRPFPIDEVPEQLILPPSPINVDPERSDLPPADHSPVDPTSLVDHDSDNLDSFVIVGHVPSQANVDADILSRRLPVHNIDSHISSDDELDTDHTPQSLPDLLPPSPITPIASQTAQNTIVSPSPTPISVSTSSFSLLHSVSPSSDSDSDHVMMSRSPADGLAEIHTKDGKAPYLSKGEITHALVAKYRSHVLSFHKTLVSRDPTVTEQQTVALIGPKLANNDETRRFWDTDGDTLVDADISAFFTALRAALFGSDWMLDLHRNLDLLVQGVDEPFKNYYQRAIHLRMALAGTDHERDDDQFRALLTRGLNTDMRAAVDENPSRLAKKTKLIDFKVELKKIESEVAKQQAQIKRGVEAYMRLQSARSSKRSSQAAGLSEPSRNANISRSSTPGPSLTPKDLTHLAKITEKDQSLFRNNNGCNKCRTFFTTCTPKTCKNEVYGSTRAKLFPISSPLTEQDVEDAKKGKGRCTPFREFSTLKATAAVVASSDLSSVAAIHEYSNVSAVLDDSPNSSFDSSVSYRDFTRFAPSPVISSVSTPSVTCQVDENPIAVPHLLWSSVISHAETAEPVPVTSMIDTGSFLVLISAETVTRCALQRKPLKSPVYTRSAFDNTPHTHKEFVRLKLHDPEFRWSARSVKALIADSLCHNIVVGLPFAHRNHLVIDVRKRTVVDKTSGFDLLHPSPVVTCSPPRVPLKKQYHEIMSSRKAVVNELNNVCSSIKQNVDRVAETPRSCPIGAIRKRVEQLARREQLERLGHVFTTKYSEIFEPLPPVHRLPDTTICSINLKEVLKPFKPKVYTCPKKYKKPWKDLIDEHLEAGRIRASDSQYASPSFIIPKADPTAAPRWVNDYRALNALTVTDRFPLPWVEDILADAAKGRIWSKMDMTNSFFHTRMNPDNVKFTAVSTPFGLYEWLVMPMGLKNAPPVHQ